MSESVCVCVCVRERERKRETNSSESLSHSQFHWASRLSLLFPLHFLVFTPLVVANGNCRLIIVAIGNALVGFIVVM